MVALDANLEGRGPVLRHWVGVVAILACGAIYLISPAVGLAFYSFSVIFLAWSNPFYIVMFFPVVIILRNADISGFGVSDGNLLAVVVALSSFLAFVKVRARTHISVEAALFWGLAFFVIVTNFYHLFFSDVDYVRTIRYSGFALSAGFAFLALSQGRYKAAQCLDSFVTIAALVISLIFIVLYYAWHTHGWFWGGRLSIRLSETTTLNTAFPIMLLSLVMFWRVLELHGSRFFWGAVFQIMVLAFLLSTGARIVVMAMALAICITFSFGVLRAAALSKYKVVSGLRISLFSLFFFFLVLLLFFFWILVDITDIELRAFLSAGGTMMARVGIWSEWASNFNLMTFALGFGVGLEEKIVGSHPHSALFAVLAYNGVLPFSALLLLFGVLFYRSLREFNQEALSVCTAGFIVFLGGVQPDRPDLWFCLLLVSALLLAAKRVRC